MLSYQRNQVLLNRASFALGLENDKKVISFHKIWVMWCKFRQVFNYYRQWFFYYQVLVLLEDIIGVCRNTTIAIFFLLIKSMNSFSLCVCMEASVSGLERTSRHDPVCAFFRAIKITCTILKSQINVYNRSLFNQVWIIQTFTRKSHHFIIILIYIV